MSHPVHPCPLSLCPSYCLSMGLPLCRCCCDGQCTSVIFEFLLWRSVCFSFVCVITSFAIALGKKINRECCPPLLLLPETSNDTSVIHTFHSTHLHPTDTTNASQVLQTQQHQKKTNLQLAFHTRLSRRRPFTSTTL